MCIRDSPYALPLAFVGSSAALDVALLGADEAGNTFALQNRCV